MSSAKYQVLKLPSTPQVSQKHTYCILLNLSCILAFKFASEVACVKNQVSHSAFHLSHSGSSSNSNSRKCVLQRTDIQVGSTEVHKSVPAYLLVLRNSLAKSLTPAVK